MLVKYGCFNQYDLNWRQIYYFFFERARKKCIFASFCLFLRVCCAYVTRMLRVCCAYVRINYIKSSQPLKTIINHYRRQRECAKILTHPLCSSAKLGGQLFAADSY